jgi:hypothetical protein
MAITTLSDAAANAGVDAIVDLIDAGSGAGYIEFYTASKPAGPGTAITDQTLLGTLTFSDPAFGAASSGTATASSITSDSSADATGTAAWARIYDSDDTAIMDVDVTETSGGGAITLNTTSIVAGGEIAITSATFSIA